MSISRFMMLFSFCVKFYKTINCFSTVWRKVTVSLISSLEKSREEEKGEERIENREENKKKKPHLRVTFLFGGEGEI